MLHYQSVLCICNNDRGTNFTDNVSGSAVTLDVELIHILYGDHKKSFFKLLDLFLLKLTGDVGLGVGRTTKR